MTSQQREYLRAQVDQAKRTTLGRHHRSRQGYCVGCGTDLDNYADGCRNCQERKRKHRIRALQAAVDIRAARRRQGLCTACARPVEDPTPVSNAECRTCWDRQRGRRRYAQKRGNSGVDG